MRFVAEQPDAKRRQLFDECRDARLVERMRVPTTSAAWSFGGSGPAAQRLRAAGGTLHQDDAPVPT